MNRAILRKKLFVMQYGPAIEWCKDALKMIGIMIIALPFLAVAYITFAMLVAMYQPIL